MFLPTRVLATRARLGSSPQSRVPSDTRARHRELRESRQAPRFRVGARGVPGLRFRARYGALGLVDPRRRVGLHNLAVVRAPRRARRRFHLPTRRRASHRAPGHRARTRPHAPPLGVLLRRRVAAERLRASVRRRRDPKEAGSAKEAKGSPMWRGVYAPINCSSLARRDSRSRTWPPSCHRAADDEAAEDRRRREAGQRDRCTLKHLPFIRFFTYLKKQRAASVVCSPG